MTRKLFLLHSYQPFCSSTSWCRKTNSFGLISLWTRHKKVPVVFSWYYFLAEVKKNNNNNNENRHIRGSSDYSIYGQEKKKAKPTVIQNLNNILFISRAGLYEQNKQTCPQNHFYIFTDSRDSRGLHMTRRLQPPIPLTIACSARCVTHTGWYNNHTNLKSQA